MKQPSPSGFREVEHTADWELQVWAADIPGLFEQTARGMYVLAGVKLSVSPRIHRWIEVTAPDLESLLVRFLEELLYLVEVDNVAFDEYQISIDGEHLRAELWGSTLIKLDKEIKAVTFHNLVVNKTESGFSAAVVFDV